MTISSAGTPVVPGIKTLLDMRAQLNDLQRQLSTGQKSNTYSGLGIDRGVSVALNSQISAISGYSDAIKNISTRLDIVQTTLNRVSAIGHEIKTGAASGTFDPDPNGQTTLQKAALSDLGELLGLLNTQLGDQYLFSGRTSDKPAVESFENILNGDGVRAGLKQLISERGQADLGTGGLGRIAIATPGPTVTQLTDDTSPFGFKLAGLSTTLTGATVTPPAGSPQVASIDLGAVNPNAGETVTFALDLPDGSRQTIVLTATASATPGPNEFSIGVDTTATTVNLQAALTTALGKEANTSLLAASAVTASSSFFNADASNPPQRVNGSPPNTSTALVAGTAANTVIWYTGEVATDPARASAVARVDTSLVVSYGTRASEEGIRWLVQNVATAAATTFLPSDPNAQARSAALRDRLLPALNVPAGTQSVENIQAELASTQSALKGTSSRHSQLNATLNDFLQQIAGVSNEDVGAQILALQTRLQASLQTTALLYQTSLVNYLR